VLLARLDNQRVRGRVASVWGAGESWVRGADGAGAAGELGVRVMGPKWARWTRACGRIIGCWSHIRMDDDEAATLMSASGGIAVVGIVIAPRTVVSVDENKPEDPMV
jgi:hypothetical protein